MDDVNFISNTNDMVDNDRTYTFFNENGEVVADKALSYAYMVTYTRQSPRYFLYLDRSDIVDPHRSSKTINRYKFVSNKVSEECFNAYIEYLKTRKIGYILLARRKLNA